MKPGIFRLVFFSLFLTGCGAEDPQAQLEEIEALQSKNLPLTEAQTKDLARLVSEGTALLAAGQKDASSEKLAEAIQVLKKAEDADRFNKSE